MKYAVTNAAISIVDKSMRIVGAKVYQKNPLHRYYLNVRAGLHNPPMDDATLSMLADRGVSVVIFEVYILLFMDIIVVLKARV